MALLDYPPEIVARALLELSAPLIERMETPLAYGELDLDGRRARFLAAVGQVRAVSQRAVMPPGQRARALDRYRRWLDRAPEGERVSEAQLEEQCAQLDSKFGSAMADAEALLDKLRPRSKASRRHPLARRRPVIEIVEPLHPFDEGLRPTVSADPIDDLMARGFNVVENGERWDVVRVREGTVQTVSRGHANAGDAWDWLIVFVFGPAGSPGGEYPADVDPPEPEVAEAAAAL